MCINEKRKNDDWLHAKPAVSVTIAWSKFSH